MRHRRKAGGQARRAEAHRAVDCRHCVTEANPHDRARGGGAADNRGAQINRQAPGWPFPVPPSLLALKVTVAVPVAIAVPRDDSRRGVEGQPGRQAP